MVPESKQPLQAMSTRNISWGKGGRCVGLTTLPPQCADCLEIWEHQPLGTLRTCPVTVQGLFYFYICIMYLVYRCNIVQHLRAGRSGDRIAVGARFSVPVQTGPETHPASCMTGTGSFPGVKCSRGVTLTPHLLPWRYTTHSGCVFYIPLSGFSLLA